MVGQEMEIELEDYILHEPDQFTLSSNWNNGVIPKSKILNCVITQCMGKMIKVDAIGQNNDPYIGLWLPKKGFKIINKK